MKTIFLLVQRAAALFQVRCLEVTLHSQSAALESTRDQATRERIIHARSTTRRQLEQASSAYIALRRIARQRSWRTV